MENTSIILAFLAIVALIAVIGLLTACLEMTFQYYMQPNMILYPYSVLLSWISAKGEVWRHLMRPLGRCRFCNGIWLFIYIFIGLTKYDLIPSYKFIPTVIIIALGMGLTSVFIALVGKYIFSDTDAAGKTDAERKISYMIDIINEDDLSVTSVMKNTPWQAMLKSYVLLGVFYSTIYVVIPIFIN